MQPKIRPADQHPPVDSGRRGADSAIESMGRAGLGVGISPTGGPMVRSVDAQLLRTLGDGQAWSVGDLIKPMGVTATAIRQRLERLLDAGLIEREKLATGRGRPAFGYRLTEQGRRCAGADPGVLAEAMWQELLELPDEAVRSRLLAGIARRLGQGLASDWETADTAAATAVSATGSQIAFFPLAITDDVSSDADTHSGPASDDGGSLIPADRSVDGAGVLPQCHSTRSLTDSHAAAARTAQATPLSAPPVQIDTRSANFVQASWLEQRLRQIGDSLAKRRITTRIRFSSDFGRGLPVLDLPHCPYPTLRDATSDRSMCELERRMISEALGGPVELSTCVLDGDSVCRFVPQFPTSPQPVHR